MGKIAFTGFAISALTTFQCINTSFQFVDNFTGVLEEIFFFNTLFLIVMHYMNCIPFLIYFYKWYEYGRRKTGLRRQRSTPNRFHDPQKSLIFLVYSMKSHIKKAISMFTKLTWLARKIHFRRSGNCNSAIEATEAQFSRFSQLYGKSCYLKSWTS